MFAKAGLQADIQSLSTQASLAALIGNSLEFANSDLVPIANARSRGLDVVIVAAGAHYEAKVPTIALITTADSPIHGAADLRGQVVGVPSLNSGPSVAVQEWLRKNGVDASAVRLIEIPLPATNAALQRGTIAAALNGEPFLRRGARYDSHFGLSVLGDRRPVLHRNLGCSRRLGRSQSGDRTQVHRRNLSERALGKRASKAVGPDRGAPHATPLRPGQSDGSQPLLDLARSGTCAAAPRRLVPLRTSYSTGRCIDALLERRDRLRATSRLGNSRHERQFCCSCVQHGGASNLCRRHQG